LTTDSIACVTFDLWETLIFDEPALDESRGRLRYEGLQRVLADRGTRLPVESLRAAYEQSALRFQEVWSRNEEVAIKEQVRLIVESAAGEPMSIDSEWAKHLENAYVDPIFAVPPKPNKDASHVLEELRNRGYKIGLISNTGRSPGEALRRLLHTYGLLKFFDACIFSNEFRLRKPDMRIFEHASHVLGTETAKMVHVGDDPEADIWGAKQAGMRAILFDSDTLDISKWGPESLYVLARANRGKLLPQVEPDRRIQSLSEVPGAIDSMFQNPH